MPILWKILLNEEMAEELVDYTGIRMDYSKWLNKVFECYYEKDERTDNYSKLASF